MSTTQPESDKFVVSASELAYVQGKLAKLVKRASKIGVPPMVLTVVREFDEEIVGDDGTVIVKKMAEITLTGEAPKYGGWTFVATVEPIDGEETNMIHKMPGIGVDVPVEYRTATMFRCDHCNTKRERNEIFVIRHENGEFKVVGRQCIKDFMGYHASPMALVRLAQSWSDFVAEARTLGGGGDGERFVSLREFIFRAAYFVNTYGYQKYYTEDVYRAPRPATKYVTYETFYIPMKQAKIDQYYGFFYNSDGTMPGNFGTGTKTMSEEEYRDAKDLADKAYDHMCTLVAGEEDALNDYFYNMRNVMQMKYIPQRYAGYAASVFPVYLKHIGAEREKNEKKQSNFVGVVGEKITFVGKLIDVRGFTSSFGEGKLLTFGDADGNRYKWFTGTSYGDALVGDMVTVTGKVKKHDEYNGFKSTVITRAKISMSGL
jgi:hypothetical protein